MDILSAKFLTSATAIEGCPAPVFPEYAFCGRSNVGKSSLLNMLTGRKDLAKTSSTPGKTQLLNHFLINENIYFADLPGYGYAKVAKTTREEWGKMVWKYLSERENLMALFMLVDIRIPPMDSDIDFANRLGTEGIPFVIAFTKKDKVTKRAAQAILTRWEKALLKTWEAMPKTFLTSSSDRSGKSEILDFIATSNKGWVKKNTP